MPEFEFTITAPATMSARVKVEAETIQEAREIALHSDFYNDPEKANFELDDGNIIDEVYLPDPSDYEVTEDNAPKM